MTTTIVLNIEAQKIYAILYYHLCYLIELLTLITWLYQKSATEHGSWYIFWQHFQVFLSQKNAYVSEIYEYFQKSFKTKVVQCF